MIQTLKVAQGIFPVITSIATSLVLAVSPSIGATLASSEARVNLNNFSHAPLDIFTLADTNTSTIATNGQVSAEANAEANFITNPIAGTQADNFSISKTSGSGQNYVGLAQSFAGIIGYNFIVGGGERFAFDFEAFLNLGTAIDHPDWESARAQGTISLEIYDTTDPLNSSRLDFLKLSSNLATQGNGDFLTPQQSSGITFNPSGTSFQTSFGGTSEYADASVVGFYARSFDRLTYLSLIETKMNEVSVKVPVPESSNRIGLLLLGLLIGYGVKRKLSA